MTPSEDSDQPALSRSLIRIFTGHNLDGQGYKVFSCGQRRLRSDYADASDSSLAAHIRSALRLVCSVKKDPLETENTPKFFHSTYIERIAVRVEFSKTLVKLYTEPSDVCWKPLRPSNALSLHCSSPLLERLWFHIWHSFCPLFVPHISFFWCLGKALFCDCGLYHAKICLLITLSRHTGLNCPHMM